MFKASKATEVIKGRLITHATAIEKPIPQAIEVQLVTAFGSLSIKIAFNTIPIANELKAIAPMVAIAPQEVEASRDTEKAPKIPLAAKAVTAPMEATTATFIPVYKQIEVREISLLIVFPFVLLS